MAATPTPRITEIGDSLSFRVNLSARIPTSIDRGRCCAGGRGRTKLMEKMIRPLERIRKRSGDLHAFERDASSFQAISARARDDAKDRPPASTAPSR
jgi:hypothetical protein